MRRGAKRGAKAVWFILKGTYNKWMENDPFRLSAVIAYYTVFSMPGLFVIIFYIAGQVFGEQAVRGEVYSEVRELLGPEGASQVQETIKAASEGQNSTVATIVGIASLIFAATGVFFHLKISLNDIWELKAVPEKAWLQVIIDRLFSFAMILVIGFLLLVSLVINSAIGAVSEFMTQHISEYSVLLISIANTTLSIVIVTLLFATIYKVLPDANISWSDVWIGALVTALLFLGGKWAIAEYIGITDPASAYGAASSIILILLWTSYASLVFFFGASFTAVYSRRYGKHIQPKKYALNKYEYYMKVLGDHTEVVKVDNEEVKKVLDEEAVVKKITKDGETTEERS